MIVTETGSMASSLSYYGGMYVGRLRRHHGPLSVKVHSEYFKELLIGLANTIALLRSAD